MESMKIPEGKPVDEYQTSFIYEKDCVKKEFTLENYPANDTSWKFVDQKSVLIKKGYVPPIHDFSITAPDGQDLTNQILANPGFTLLMISKKIKEADPKRLAAGFELGIYCMAKGIGFYIVTASGSGELSEYNNGLTFFTGDETTLKTIVRSNPGYMLMKGGKIAGKWSWASLPQKEKFIKDLHAGRMNKKSPVLTVYSLALSAILLILLISSIYKRNRAQTEN
jgi:triosephosphate isomerase